MGGGGAGTYAGPMTAPSPTRPRSSGWVLGHVGGSPVVLAPSWLLVALVLTVLFLPTVRAGAPGLGTAATVAAAAGLPVLLAISVFLHELGHGLTARRLGIPVTEYVITFWGGHTQFDRELRTPGVSALVAVAGPAVNAALGWLSWWAAVRTSGVPGLLLAASAVANGFVAAFNLLPGLPLDGGRVLEAAVWKATGDRTRGLVVAAWAGRVIAVTCAVVGLGWPLLVGSRPTLAAVATVLLVAAFLWTGAGQTLKAVRSRQAAARVDLIALAGPALVVPLAAPVTVLDQVPAGGAAVVVVDGAGRPVAIVDPVAAAQVPTHLRASTGVVAVSRPLPPVAVVPPLTGQAAVAAMTSLQHASPVAVVLDEATSPPLVRGVVAVAAVARALTARP